LGFCSVSNTCVRAAEGASEPARGQRRRHRHRHRLLLAAGQQHRLQRAGPGRPAAPEAGRALLPEEPGARRVGGAGSSPIRRHRRGQPRASERAGGRKAAEEEEEREERGRGPPGGGKYKVKPHCQTCSRDCSSCCRCAAPEAAPRRAGRGLLQLLARSPSRRRRRRRSPRLTLLLPAACHLRGVRSPLQSNAIKKTKKQKKQKKKKEKEKQPSAPSTPLLLRRQLASSLQLRQPRLPFPGSRAASLAFRHRRLSQSCNIGDKQVRGWPGSRGLGGGLWKEEGGR
jgi:hypothetical protein